MGIIIATLLVLLVIASALAQDFSFISWAYWQEEGDSGTSRSEVFRNFGLFVAAGVALVFAFWRAKIATRQAEAAAERADATIKQARAANEQARIAEQGQFTERFSRAAEQLGNPALPVRLGGIYGLWRLAEDSSLRDLISVIDILCAFVRDPPQLPVDRPEPDTDEGAPGAAEDKTNATNKLRADVQVIFDLIGDWDAPYRARLPSNQYLDLTGANLRVANLGTADLSDADLTDANLSDANLSDADLSEAILTGADLTRANLSDAVLTDANLTKANLSDANLAGANLTDANLTKANLSDANLAGANLTDANLTGANLTHADLTDANLNAANLAGANLTLANLRGALLTNADLWGAILLGTEESLEQHQLESACITQYGDLPILPEGLEPPQNVCPPRAR